MPDTLLPKDILDPAVLDAVLSIETYLHPSLRGPGSAMEEAGARLAAGRLVAIREAFEPAFAEQMHHSLDACTTWRVYEKYEEHFHYHHHNLYECPPDLAWCDKVFSSAATKAWVTRLSGRLCMGPTEFSASWYLPGDHSLPHNDAIASGDDARRQVAFIWHLAKDWQSEWGGALFWCRRHYTCRRSSTASCSLTLGRARAISSRKSRHTPRASAWPSTDGGRARPPLETRFSPFRTGSAPTGPRSRSIELMRRPPAVNSNSR